MARPTDYTAELCIEVCSRLADGESLRRICKDDHIPERQTLYRWLFEKTFPTFNDQYALARRMQAENLADELFDIADDGANDWMMSNDPENPGWRVNGECLGRSRLRVDTRKWYMSKVLTRFADKPEDAPAPLGEAIEFTRATAQDAQTAAADD